MSDAAGDSSSWAIRWRAVYDVAIGVVLFLVLLVPAMRQASTGTHAGLRHAMLLLLLDLVVLVVLSRYMTSEGRRRLWGPAVEQSPADPPLPREELAGLLDARGAPSPELGLVFTDDDIAIRQGPEDHSPLAHLAWSDCAAVVASEMEAPDGTAMVFLQFVAVREDRIRLVHGLRRTRGAGRMLGVSETAGAMVWGVPARFVHLLPPLLAHVEQYHPHVRVVLPEGPRH
jgi:hypothetical protein